MKTAIVEGKDLQNDLRAGSYVESGLSHSAMCGLVEIHNKRLRLLQKLEELSRREAELLRTR